MLLFSLNYPALFGRNAVMLFQMHQVLCEVTRHCVETSDVWMRRRWWVVICLKSIWFMVSFSSIIEFSGRACLDAHFSDRIEIRVLQTR